MQTIIKWHKTSEELPPVNVLEIKGKQFEFDKPCLVVWNNRIKPSTYIRKQNRWEGHTAEQVPEYWVTLDELITENENE